MRAVVMHQQGGPEVLGIEDVPVPTPGPAEVLVRIEAVGVSYHETPMRAGVFPMPMPLPAVFGFESAGTVVAVGPEVDAALVGRRVVAMNMRGGSYAEYTTVPVAAATPIPDGLSAAAAVTVAVQGSIALCLQRGAALDGGETVLVEVATGSIGGYLTQLLRAGGAGRIIATVGGKAKVDVARELGADDVVDHTDPDWADRLAETLDSATVDAVFESIGGDVRYLDLLTPGTGKILFYGILGGPFTITPLDLLSRGLTLIGCGGVAAWGQRVQVARPEALELAAAGRIRPAVDTELPLADAAEAHRRIEAREVTGKIVLVP